MQRGTESVGRCRGRFSVTLKFKGVESVRLKSAVRQPWPFSPLDLHCYMCPAAADTSRNNRRLGRGYDGHIESPTSL